MYFIEPLESIQSLFGREAKGDVCIPLKFRKVISLRHRVLFFLAYYTYNPTLLVLPLLHLFSSFFRTEPYSILFRIVGGCKISEVTTGSIVVLAQEGIYFVFPLRH